ncbi:hypothetical protein G9A89_019232 [Geosiphon pyriformis]|nr:hypothetical protein G9A89_019232 [Geosiphon pyriformis]
MIMSLQNFDDFTAFHNYVLEKLGKQQKYLINSSSSSSNVNDLKQKLIDNKVVVRKSTSRGWLGNKTWGLLEHAGLVTSQATRLTANFLAHHLTGPRRPSWPVQVTIMSSFMRNLSNHTHLADVKLIRRLCDFPNPLLPSDILVTPVSFKVYNRGLNGILKELDQRENGIREIDGEWVVQKSLWSKINTEYQVSVANKQHFWIDENNVKWSNEKVILAIHGGAYYVMSTRTHRDLHYRLSKATGRRVFATNYRLAPEGPFPCGLHDVIHSYLYLTDPNGLAIQPQNIVVSGDSAGGGLTLALIFYLRDQGMPLPGGVLLISPWVDLTMSCSSWESNQEFDILIKPKDEDAIHPVRLYLSPFEERSHLITHPYVSPLFGDMNHLPPILIQCGDSEVLRDEILLLADKIEKTGTTFVQCEIYEDMIHVFQTFGFLEPAQKAVDAAGYWVKNVLPLHHRNINLIRAQQCARAYSVPNTSQSIELYNAGCSYADSRSSQSTPSFAVAEDTVSYEDESSSEEESFVIKDGCCEELNNKLSGMAFYGPSEPLPTKCDKATSTEEDGIILSASNPIETSADLKSSKICLRPRRRVNIRSSSNPELRQFYTISPFNAPTPEHYNDNRDVFANWETKEIGLNKTESDWYVKGHIPITKKETVDVGVGL